MADRVVFAPTWWEDAILCESDGHFAMIDTGHARSAPQLLALLQSCGVTALDFILITHDHDDHSGGLAAILDAIPTAVVYYKPYSGCDAVGGGGQSVSREARAEIIHLYHAALDTVRAKTQLVMITEELPQLRMGHMTFTVFNKDNIVRRMYEDADSAYRGQYVFNENNNSAMVYVRCDGGGAAFLTGDCYDEPLTYAPGRLLLTKAAQAIGGHVAVYKPPHHGCGDFTSEETAQTLSPDFVVATTDADAMHSDARYTESMRKLRAANKDVQLCCPVGCGFRFTFDGPAATVERI